MFPSRPSKAQALQARTADASASPLPTPSRSVAGRAVVEGPVGSGELRVAGKPPYDVASLLPEQLQWRFQRLRDERADASAAAYDAQNKRNDAHSERIAAKAAFDKIDAELRLRTRFAHDGEDSLADDPRWQSAKSKFEFKDAEFKRLDARATELSERSNRLGSLVQNNCEAHLKDLARVGVTSLEAYEGPAPKVKGSPAAAVDTVRKQIDKLKAQADAIRTAPHPSAKAKELAREQINRLAEQGQPRCVASIDHGEPIGFARSLVQSPEEGVPAIPHLYVQNALATMAWLLRDELVAALEAEIDRRADDEHSLDDETRASRLADVTTKLLAAEREECALIELAAGTIEYRADCDPKAVLGIV
jgi:hypothetical protein